MKKAIVLVAFVAAIITAGVSCNWFGSRNAAGDRFIGNWRIDSIDLNDTSAIGDLLIAMTFDDSASHHFTFTKDSLAVIGKDTTEVSAWRLDEDKKLISIGDEGDFGYEFLSDSSLKLLHKDSTAYFLVKK